MFASKSWRVSARSRADGEGTIVGSVGGGGGRQWRVRRAIFTINFNCHDARDNEAAHEPEPEPSRFEPETRR
jgi:hypothetical protein